MGIVITSKSPRRSPRAASPEPAVNDPKHFKVLMGKLPEMTDLDKAKLVSAPLPGTVLETVRKVTGASVEEFQNAMAMTQATWKRRVGKHQVLDLQESESLVRISQVSALADRIIGKTGSEWLRESHPHLDGQTPLAACRTEPGGRAVEAMLWSIDAGNMA